MPSFYEASFLRDDGGEHTFDSISNDVGDYFIVDITEGNRYELIRSRGIDSLGYEGKEGGDEG